MAADDFFSTEVRRLDAEMVRRRKQVAAQRGMTEAEASIALGRVLISLGTILMGTGLGLPHEVALPVGHRALDEFARIVESSN